MTNEAPHLRSDLLFHTELRSWDERKVELRHLMNRYPGTWRNLVEAEAYQSNIRMPASLRWALKCNDKAGSSTTLRVLFELEYGIPLTVSVVSPDDINQDVVAHMGYGAGLFRPPAQIAGGVEALMTVPLRIATVRHPVSRAVSGFRYLCLTQTMQSVWLARERLRLSALTGFDWTRHIYTSDGLLRFLDYVEEMHRVAKTGGLAVNTHWLRQWNAIRPDLFQPHIVGRTESFGSFMKTLAERLDRPLPADWQVPTSNRQQPETAQENMVTPLARRRIVDVYETDFTAFGYDA